MQCGAYEILLVHNCFSKRTQVLKVKEEKEKLRAKEIITVTTFHKSSICDRQ